MKNKKTNKMNTVVSINWRIRDLIREKLSFEDWHLEIFGKKVSRKTLKMIKERDKITPHLVGASGLIPANLPD